MTMAQALARFLKNQRVEQFDGAFLPLLHGIWGIYGHGNVNGVGEALWEYRKEIPYFRGQNEQGMSLAAIAFAKAQRCRQIMGVTTSIGPGATNCVTACALAHVNRLPVLFLPGDVFASRRPDPVLQQLEDERSPLRSVNDCFQPVSRYFDRITRPEQLIESLPQAVRVLLSPAERGPVTLCLPQDCQTEVFDYSEELFAEKVHYIERPEPDERALERAVRLLKRAQTPFLIAGGGVQYSGAEKTLKDFVEKHQIPIAETQAGKGALPWDHPLNLGAIGVTGSDAANRTAENADLILCVGTRLTDFTTSSKSLFHRKGVSFVAINTHPFDAIKGSGEALVADAQKGLEKISLKLDAFSYSNEIEGTVQEWREKQKEMLASSSGRPSDAEVLAAVNKAIGKKGTVVCAAGGLPGELHKHWRAHDAGSYHVEYGYSCMGYEIAGGLGVKFACPERDVVVLVGDGSYLMLHTELLTAVQLGIDIQIVLLDNHGYGCINRLQKESGSPPYGNLFEERTPDFVMNAKSYGCHAEKVDSIEGLKQTVEKNSKRKGPSLIVIETDPQKATPSYGWWDVPIAAVSSEPTVREKRKSYQERLENLHGRQ